MRQRSVELLQGTVLEKYLTHTPEEFARLMKSSEPPTEVAPHETYRYSTVSLGFPFYANLGLTRPLVQ